MSWLEGLAEDDWSRYHSDSEVSNIAKASLALLNAEPLVVRCADCAHFDDYNVKCMMNHAPKPQYKSWYCADGKQR